MIDILASLDQKNMGWKMVYSLLGNNETRGPEGPEALT